MSAPTKSGHQTAWLSPQEAGAYLSCTGRTIRRWIAEGRLPAKRFGPRVVRVHVDDLNRLGDEIPTVGAAS
jgi:excisionase family DNA binding protein